MNSFDLTVFHFMNQRAGHIPWLDPIMAFIAQYSLEVYAILFVVAWFALPRREEQKRHALIVAVFGGILALVVNVIIGSIWVRPRPFVAMPHAVHQLIPHVADASFPSDHTAGGFGFAAASWGHSAKWVSYTFTILGVLIMISRVYVGVHWPTDVIGGMIIGIICGRVAHLFSSPLGFVTRILLRIFRMGR